MSRTVVSARPILVVPDLVAASLIERAIKDVARTRGSKTFGRGPFAAACLRAIAECGISFAGCHGEPAIAARLVDIIRRGLQPVASAASKESSNA